MANHQAAVAGRVVGDAVATDAAVLDRRRVR
jgi:hypothetical protein